MAFGNYYVENITSWMDHPHTYILEEMVDPYSKQARKMYTCTTVDWLRGSDNHTLCTCKCYVHVNDETLAQARLDDAILATILFFH